MIVGFWFIGSILVHSGSITFTQFGFWQKFENDVKRYGKRRRVTEMRGIEQQITKAWIQEIRIKKEQLQQKLKMAKSYAIVVV